MPDFPNLRQLNTSTVAPISGQTKDYSADGTPNFRVFFSGKYRRTVNFLVDSVQWTEIEGHFISDSDSIFLFTDQRDGAVVSVRYDVGGNPRRVRGDDVPVGMFLASVKLVDV